MFKNDIPSHITDAVIEIAPINTNTGGIPKYTSVKIPIGINKPIMANQEIVLVFFNFD